MVSKAYRKCLLLIEKMVKHNYVNQIDKAKLKTLISKYIGADKRTINKYVSVCVQFEFLKPHLFQKTGEVAVYKIDLAKADAAMNEVYGRNLRQTQLLQKTS